MNFDWSEYLNLAKDLIGEAEKVPCEEAKLRTSISRAYYSVYHKALNLIEMCGDLPKDQLAMHGFVKNWFYDNNEKYPALRLRDIGDIYKALKAAREYVDYFVMFPSNYPELNKVKAEQVIYDSEDTIKKIQKIITQISSH